MLHYQNYIYKIVPFILLIFSIILSIWMYNKNIIKYSTISQIDDSFDYIVVGGGTSGCVLAAKLSENTNKSVLLIEAGDQFNFLSSVPLLTVLLQGSKYDWAFKSQPQKFSSFGLHNQIQSLPRGKGLGGSNQINYMVHGIDIKDEVEKWILLGINNWNYKKLEPYIYSLFHAVNSTFNTTASKSELNNLLLKSIQEVGQQNIKYVSNKNTINFGKRWTSYHSHLKQVTEREHLHIVLNAQVTKVIFDNNNHAIGVEVTDNNYKRIIYNRREVILSAGAFNTPQILFLSGIGPAHVLDNFRIPTIVDLPGVGKNLHDHLNMPMYVSINKPLSLTLDKVLRLSQLWEYLRYGEGLLSETPNAGFVRKHDTGFLLFGMGSTDENTLKQIANIKTELRHSAMKEISVDEILLRVNAVTSRLPTVLKDISGGGATGTFETMFPLHKNTSQEGFVLLTTCLKPVSRGYVSLRDKNHERFVKINPHYLSKYKDIECMIRAIKLANKILNTTTFKNIGAKIHWPKFTNCQLLSSDEYLECIIRTGALTGYHPGGSCRMGKIEDRLTVVDDTLKVKGVTGLRIMDASILPEPLPTYPNSVLVVMAEYAADIIKNELNN